MFCEPPTPISLKIVSLRVGLWGTLLLVEIRVHFVKGINIIELL